MNIRDLLVNIEAILVLILVALVVIAWDIRGIAKRTREMIPTEGEADDDLAMKDPMGHWEAHKKEPDPKK